VALVIQRDPLRVESVAAAIKALQIEIGVSGPLPARLTTAAVLEFILPGRLQGNTSIISRTTRTGSAAPTLNGADAGLTFNMALPPPAAMNGIVRTADVNDC
jgi:hypothetical protein